MSKERKRRKLTEEEILNSGNLAVSIGEILGKAEKVPAKRGSDMEKSVGQAPSATQSAEETIKLFTKITLHRQSAGMGGKVATVVTLSGGSVSLEALAKELRKGLGCGSRVEGGKILLQGDIQERARDWFIKKGAKSVVLGN